MSVTSDVIAVSREERSMGIIDQQIYDGEERDQANCHGRVSGKSNTSPRRAQVGFPGGISKEGTVIPGDAGSVVPAAVGGPSGGMRCGGGAQ